MQRTPPLHGWFFRATWQGYAGLVLISAGLAIRSWASGVLVKNKLLTTTGPYSICRHPLYMGSFLMVLGFCSLFGHVDYFVATAVLAFTAYPLAIHFEERRLASLYGDKWEAYVRHVPRFPWKRVKYAASSWMSANWRSSREYRTMLSCALGLVAMEVWRFCECRLRP
ncbi:MAG: isoprenylcysteine carboxylmethyltransferase family protein [Planctomycetes bacterium]|nr:isoprenylcysteine carboxylmethyltransferase family protein [Planctomycetota bacterium]